MEGKTKDPELLWREYNLHVDLYKYHMKTALNAVNIYYLITGALLGVFFNHPANNLRLLRLALILPTLMSITFGGGFIYAGYLARIRKRRMDKLANHLELESPPNMNILAVLFFAFGTLFFIVAVLLILFMIEAAKL